MGKRISLVDQALERTTRDPLEESVVAPESREMIPPPDLNSVKGLNPAWYGLSTAGQLADAITTLRFDPAHEQNPVGRFLLKNPPLAVGTKLGAGLGAAAIGDKIFKEGKKKRDKTLMTLGRLVPLLVGGMGFALAYNNEKNVPKKGR